MSSEEGGQVPRWWVVNGDRRVLAGPFGDRVDAGSAREDAAVAAYRKLETAGAGEPDCNDAAVAVTVAYGVPGLDGLLSVRATPEDRAFEAYLSEELDKLTDGWNAPLSAATGPQAVLARQVATALVEAGFTLHDCAGLAGEKARGGVCLTPNTPGSGGHPAGGVIVAWTQHDRMALDHTRGYQVYADVQDTMNYAVADVLLSIGFTVQQFGQASAHIATTAPTTPAAATAGDPA